MVKKILISISLIVMCSCAKEQAKQDVLNCAYCNKPIIVNDDTKSDYIILQNAKERTTTYYHIDCYEQLFGYKPKND